MFYVYVLKVANEEKFYLVCTKDLRERLKSHNAGENKSSKGNQWKLVYYEAYINFKSAIQREQSLKKHGKLKQSLMQRIKASLIQ